MRKIFFALALLFGGTFHAFAACPGAGGCFWVGGTGTWDATTTHWSASTGGAAGVGPPDATSPVTFDGSSGGGTVTVNTTVNVVSITMGAFTGTLTFATNNNNVTLQTFSGTGSGTRTLSMGNGTWTITGNGSTIWDITTATNLTLNANSSTLTFSGGGAANALTTFQGGGKTYNTVNFGSFGGTFNVSGANTFATLGLTAPLNISFGQGSTHTITNAFNWVGTSSNPFLIRTQSTGFTANISVPSGTPTMSWAGIKDIVFTGGATFTATNSFNFGNNTGITITGPSSGGGHIIGG